jgi:hypothetical protein
MDRGVEGHKGAVFGSKGADPVRYGCGRAKTLPDGTAIPFPPRLPGDAQGGHARACAQHNGSRARRGLDGAEMAQRESLGRGGRNIRGAPRRRGYSTSAREISSRTASVVCASSFPRCKTACALCSGSDDATGGPCHCARSGRLRLAGRRGRHPSRRATRGGLPRLASPPGAGLQPAVYLRDEGSPGPWCPSEAELRRTRNYVRDCPDAPRSPPRSSRSSLRSAGAPRRCSRCPAQRRERLCR